METATMPRPRIDADRTIDAHALGIGFGVLLGCSHLAWSLLVLVGCAQTLLDFVFWLHFIEPPYRVGTFAWPRALALIAVTSGIGYAIGALGGVIWNRLETVRTRY